MRNANNDRITISLYSVQNGETFDPVALKEIDNIYKIKLNFDHEAKKSNRKPPEIVVSVLLVPDWENNNSYADPIYQIAKNNFMRTLRERLDSSNLTGIVLEDFYVDALSEPEYASEKSYLVGLKARNRNSDMIKTHSIIALCNNNRRHLQMDSNTKVHDYCGLYNTTFGAASVANNTVLLNASRYKMHFICASNKVVYTAPGSLFVSRLREIYLAYCEAHKNDHQFSQTKVKREKHSIYYNAFEVALSELGLVKPITVIDDETSEKKKRIYPALLERPEYILSAFIVTAVNLLLKDPDQVPKHHNEKLKRFPSVIVGDASCDFASFIIAVKRHTENLWIHKYAGKYDEFKEDQRINNTEKLFDDIQTRAQLFAISNTTVDKAIITRFYAAACNYVTKTSISEDDFETIKVLATIIPDNPLGNQLTLELFGCAVRELHESPLRGSSQREIPELVRYFLQEKIKMKREHEPLTQEEIFYRDVYCQPNGDFQRILEDQLGEDFSAITRSLERNGIVALPRLFSGAQLQQMQQDFNRWCDGKVPDVHAHIQLGGSVEEEYFTDSPSMCRAVAHPLIWALSAHAWGRDPVLSAMRAYRINPLPPKRYRAFQPHNDGHGKEFKVMVLLTDVRPGEQGMRYWQGTQNVQWQIHSSRDTLYTDAEAAQLGEPFECVGPAGTIFIFNINGIHSGVRNESVTRDTLVFSITAGKRMYPIPPLHDSVTSTLTDYEKAIFRCGRENDTHETEGELSVQQRDETLMTYLATYSEEVRRTALYFRSAVESQSSTKFYAESPFPIPTRPVPITMTYDQADIDALIQLTDQDLFSAINEDPKRGMALPIRLYSGSRDKSRDLALCYIRDIWLSTERNAIIAEKIKQNNVMTHLVSCDELLTYQSCAQFILTFLDRLTLTENRNPVSLNCFKDFLKDLDQCLKTADSYVLVRAGLSFLLAIVDYFSENLIISNSFKNELNAIFTVIAQVYAGHIQLELYQKNQKANEQGNEFRKYVSQTAPVSLLFREQRHKETAVLARTLEFSAGM